MYMRARRMCQTCQEVSCTVCTYVLYFPPFVLFFLSGHAHTVIFLFNLSMMFGDVVLGTCPCAQATDCSMNRSMSLFMSAGGQLETTNWPQLYFHHVLPLHAQSNIDTTQQDIYNHNFKSCNVAKCSSDLFDS